MAAILAAISAGGLTGVSNQYLYLLLLSLAGRFNLLGLTTQMSFMTSDWFIALAAVLWLLSIAPSYAPLIAPGLANAANTVSNFMHGTIVPISSGLIGLAAAGFVTMTPEVEAALGAIRLFSPDGAIQPAGIAVAGGSAVLASSLTGIKFLAKPGVAAATGTAGHVSAPMFATLENAAAVVVVAVVYFLSRVNPWLLVAFGAVVAILMVVLAVASIVTLYRLGKGAGKVFRLIEEQPRAGWAIVAEALVWGLGSLIWSYPTRAAPRLVLWAGWVILLIVGVLLWSIPVIGWALYFMLIAGGLGGGLMWARSLMSRLEQDGHLQPTPAAQPQGMAAAAH